MTEFLLLDRLAGGAGLARGAVEKELTRFRFRVRWMTGARGWPAR